MRSKVTPEQFAELEASQAQSLRSLAVAEATLLLLRDRESALQKVSDRLSDQIDAQTRQFAQLIVAVQDTLVTISRQVERTAEITMVPQGDYPTVEELVEQAKADPAKKKLLEVSLAELEFENTEIEYN